MEEPRALLLSLPYSLGGMTQWVLTPETLVHPSFQSLTVLTSVRQKGGLPVAGSSQRARRS
jgi:hypothetical protein